MHSDVKRFTGLDAPSQLTVVNGAITRKNGNNDPLYLPEFEGKDICIMTRDDYIEQLKRSQYNFDLAEFNARTNELLMGLIVPFANLLEETGVKISDLRKEFEAKYPQKIIKTDQEKPE